MEALVARATRLLLSAILSLSLPTAAAASPVTGSVVDASGAAVVRAFVRLVDAAGRERSATITDDRGRFVVELADCADCRIEASLVGFRATSLAVTATQSADARFQPRLTLQVAPISDTVVVTPTRDAAPSSQTGASVSVFTADDIARRGFPSVADLLRETTGTSVIRSGGLGSVTSLFMRGGDSHYTKVLLDGVPLNEPGGTFNFGNLSTGNIARVEVVRGAQSALFGSDAMSGVIQLFTMRGAAVRPSITGAFEGGGYGTSRSQVSMNGLRRGWDYAVGVVRFDTDNRAPNSAFTNTTVSWNGGGALGGGVSLRVTGRVEQGRTGVPGATAFGRPDADAFFDRQDVVAGATLEHQRSRHWQQRASYAFTRSNQESANLIADPDYVPTYGASTAPFAFSDYTYDSQNVLRRHFLNYQADARLTGRVNQVVTLLADWEGERATLNDRLAGTSLPAARNNLGVSVQHQLFGRRGSLTTSVRIEHNGSFGNAWVPRASGAWIVRRSSGAIGNTTLRGNIGTGVKEPTVLQSFSPNAGFLGNPDLLPERARTWDAGIEQRLAADRARLELTYFDNRYQDQITTRTMSTNPFRSQFVNRLSVTTARGLEASAEIAPVASLRFGGGYTFLDATALLRRPRHAGFVRASWTWRAASADINGTYVGAHLDNDFSALSPALTSSGDEWLWQAAARYRFSDRIDGYVRVQNLTDRDYMEPLGFPAWRRTAHAGLHLRF